MTQPDPHTPPATRARRGRTPNWLRSWGRSLSGNTALAAVSAWLAVRFLKLVFRTNSWVGSWRINKT